MRSCRLIQPEATKLRAKGNSAAVRACERAPHPKDAVSAFRYSNCISNKTVTGNSFHDESAVLSFYRDPSAGEARPIGLLT